MRRRKLMIAKCRKGVFEIALDNTGATDVGGEINKAIQKHTDENGVDLEFLPGTYLVKTPIVIDKDQVSLSGPAIGWMNTGIGPVGKVTFLAHPECPDIVIIGSSERNINGVTIQRISFAGQNGRIGCRPNIDPQQNGIRIVGDARLRNLVIDFCQFVYLTYAILFIREAPKAIIDVLYIVDNWIGECNYGIWLDAGVYASIISRNGLHDFTETALHLAGSEDGHNRHLKETLISNNQGWNTGKLAFDIDKFSGGAISSNAFNFSHGNCQAFGRFRNFSKTTINGNSWIAEKASEPSAAQGAATDRQSQQKAIVSLSGVSDSNISNNTFESFSAESPIISVGEDHGIPSERNQFIYNRLIRGGQMGMAIQFAKGSADNVYCDAGIENLDIIDNGKNNKVKIL